MRGFERNFLLAEGLPDRIQYRHVVSNNSFENAEKNNAELDRNKLKQETSLYKIKT